jgi:hypothetical protein
VKFGFVNQRQERQGLMMSSQRRSLEIVSKDRLWKVRRAREMLGKGLDMGKAVA